MKFLHRFLRDHLHGGHALRNHGEASATAVGILEKGEEIKCCYAAYASAVANANAMLQRHGPDSEQFTQTNIASMRLFHRVKKIQGMGKPRPDAA